MHGLFESVSHIFQNNFEFSRNEIFFLSNKITFIYFRHTKSNKYIKQVYFMLKFRIFLQKRSYHYGLRMEDIVIIPYP